VVREQLLRFRTLRGRWKRRRLRQFIHIKLSIDSYPEVAAAAMKSVCVLNPAASTQGGRCLQRAVLETGTRARSVWRRNRSAAYSEWMRCARTHERGAYGTMEHAHAQQSIRHLNYLAAYLVLHGLSFQTELWSSLCRVTRCTICDCRR
jgi:hypothetical protein